jgi:hypothetical protein
VRGAVVGGAFDYGEGYLGGGEEENGVKEGGKEGWG